ncbi:CocE/NonD family hydrolase [Streptomyces sp. NPDC087843]|uniref:CocE/NonD family hydrolase n=1 Tax=Streptomyces sp. NPDC087843 TaxID=3365804 RepID=UPI0038001397
MIEFDAEVVLRDGVRIYTDVFRPADATGVPAIVAWSPYGKGGGGTFDHLPGRGGVPEGIPSPWAKIEGPDPAYWCRQGCAVINPDPRGVHRSEGEILQWGTQGGWDAADLIVP